MTTTTNTTPTTAPGPAPELRLTVWPRFIAADNLGPCLVFERGPALGQLDARKRAAALGVSDSVAAVAAKFFESGDGRMYADAKAAARAAEKAAAEAEADVDRLNAAWHKSIADDDLDAAAKIEAKIAAAKALAGRIKARGPYLEQAAAGLRDAAVASLDKLIKDELTTIAATATAEADAARAKLCDAVSLPYAAHVIAMARATEAGNLARRTTGLAGTFFS